MRMLPCLLKEKKNGDDIRRVRTRETEASPEGFIA